MKVEIQLSDEEVASMRGDRRHSSSLMWLIYDKVEAALPRPIQVGDTVRSHDHKYEVRAIDDVSRWAWLRSLEGRGYFSLWLGDLTLVPAAAADKEGTQ